MGGLPAKPPAGRERPILVREQKCLNTAKHKAKLTRRKWAQEPRGVSKARTPRVL